MAPKSFLVTGLVVMLLVAAPAVEAQLQGIGGIIGGIGGIIGGIGGIIGGILNLLHIQGIVPCSQNIGAAINGTLTPVFPNAQVQLTCGVGNIIATATTNSAGIFSIALNPVDVLLSEVLNNCRLVVPTPLSNCNPALPAVGVLQSALQIVGNIFTGLLNIVNIVPTGFQFLQV